MSVSEWDQSLYFILSFPFLSLATTGLVIHSTRKLPSLNICLHLEQDILVESSCDSSSKLRFNKTELTNFWLLPRSDYPALRYQTLRHLIPFCTTYLCEQAFSELLYMKSTYRNKLNIEADFRIKLFNKGPNIAALVS